MKTLRFEYGDRSCRHDACTQWTGLNREYNSL